MTSEDSISLGSKISSPLEHVDNELEPISINDLNNSILPPFPSHLPWPSLYKISKYGVSTSIVTAKGEMIERTLFGPLIVKARTRDRYDIDWGLLLSIRAPDGQWHDWAMPMTMLSGKNKYLETLLYFGLQMEEDSQKHLYTYLMTAKPDRFVRCVKSTGWHDNVFVLPDCVFGKYNEDIFLQNRFPNTLFKQNGTLQDWNEHIGQYCCGNSRMIFAASAGFAAPLMRLCDLEGGGVHFVGGSSIGKSILLNLAGSVAGGGGEYGFLRRWRVTDNALEEIAQTHNDGLLCLDELGQVNPKVAADAAYMLSNGQGKARMNKDAVIQPIPEWRVLFLSSGELSLQERIEEDGQRYMAGQAVRILDIPADAGCDHGVFENLHSFSGGKTFAEHLHKAALKFYGAPLRAFLNFICNDIESCRKQVEELMRFYQSCLNVFDTDGQVNRAIKRFALFAAAGELAVSAQILPWQPGDPFKAAQTCFDSWLTKRGGQGGAEEKEMVRLVRTFINVHYPSRFLPWDRTAKQSDASGRAGFYRESAHGGAEFLIFPDVFRQEICRGGDYRIAARHLAKAGYLKLDGEGNFTKTHIPPGWGQATRLYTILGSVLAADI